MVTSWVTCASASGERPGALGAHREHGRAPQRGRGERHASVRRQAVHRGPRQRRAHVGQPHLRIQGQPEDGAHPGAHRLGAVQVGGARERWRGRWRRRPPPRAAACPCCPGRRCRRRRRPAAAASRARRRRGSVARARGARAAANTAMTSGGVSSVLIFGGDALRDRVDGRGSAALPHRSARGGAELEGALRRARRRPAAGGRRRGRPRRGRRLRQGRRLHARGTCADAATPPS